MSEDISGDLVTALRALSTERGATPAGDSILAAAREVITACGGTPHSQTILGAFWELGLLLAGDAWAGENVAGDWLQAIQAVTVVQGGTPVSTTVLGALWELLTVLGTGGPPTTGLLAWYNAGALSAADGDLISSWTDSSGHGHAATGSGSQRPTYKAAILNGKPVLRFAGGQALVADFGSTQAQPFSIAWVVSITSAAKYILDTSDGGGAHRVIVSQGVFRANAVEMYAGDVGCYLAQTPPVAAAQYLAVYNGNSSTLYKGDGGAASSGSAGSNSLGGVTIGARFSLEDFLSGDIAELLFYDHALDGTERAAIASYLTGKYGV